MLEKSEASRLGFKQELQRNAVKVREDAQAHNTFEDQLHCEIKTLKLTIQSVEEKAARTKQ
jgi:hypothetical protein